MGRIVDVNGVPFDEGSLSEEIAGPTLTGVRQVWNQWMARDLTPERIARILEQSIENYDPREYLMLADHMEELEPQYFSQLGTRKMAVEGIAAEVDPASDSAEDKKLAAFAAEVMSLDCVEESRPDLMDALAKSFSVSEIVWDRSGKQWMPMRLKHREGHWFLFDQVDRDTLRLRDEADLAFGVPLKPYKFIVHRPKVKAGIRIRNGLARVIAFTWICKAYALKDWMAFAEVFGMPVRVGKYPATATARDIAILRRAVANIGTDAAAVMPESMKLEFEQVGNVAGGSDLFLNLCTYLDKQISKAILGQTMTADDGSSLGQAKVHDQVRSDIRDSDCRQLERTYQRDLIKPAIDLNFGVQERYPKVRIQFPEKDDLDKLTNAVSRLVPLGLKVGQGWARSKIGAPDPAPDEELLRAPAPVAQPGAEPPPDDAERAQNRATKPPLAAAQPDEPSRMTDLLESRADATLDAMLVPIRRLVEGATSLEEIRDGLDALFPSIDESQLAGLLREAMAAAWLTGRFDVSIGQ